MDALRRNFFDLFSLPATFELDEAALDCAWRALQGAVHPDRHAGAPESQRRMAMQKAARVNEAVRTLRDPCRRAECLCVLNGISIEAESNTAMPGDFLIRQMQWREDLDEAMQAGDAHALDARADFQGAVGLVRQLMFVDRFGAGIDAAEAAEQPCQDS